MTTRTTLLAGILLSLIALGLLVGCARTDPPLKPSASAIVPPSQQVCPDGARPPPTPKAPRTIPQIIDWGVGVFDAWYRTEMARQECARRLAALNQWIDDRLTKVPPAP